MAAYPDIFNKLNDSPLRNRVLVAGLKKTDLIAQLATPSAGQIDWVKRYLNNVEVEANRLFLAVLGANVDATIAQIDSATDTQLQNQVNNVVDKVLAG